MDLVVAVSMVALKKSIKNGIRSEEGEWVEAVFMMFRRIKGDECNIGWGNGLGDCVPHVPHKHV